MSTGQTDARSGGSSAPGRQKGQGAAQKYARKARPGNVNALKHGAFLTAAKHEARVARDRHRRRAERDWRAVLVEHRLASHRLARAIAREGAFLLGTRLRIEAHLETRGFFNSAGELKPAVSKAIEVSARLLDDCRQLLEELVRVGLNRPDEGHVYQAQLSDGTHAVPTPEEIEEHRQTHTRPRARRALDAEAPAFAAGAGQETRSSSTETPMPSARRSQAAALSAREEAPSTPQAPPSGDPLGLGWITVAGGDR